MSDQENPLRTALEDQLRLAHEEIERLRDEIERLRGLLAVMRPGTTNVPPRP